jgi:hypothetical protein
MNRRNYRTHCGRPFHHHGKGGGGTWQIRADRLDPGGGRG